MSEVLSPVSSFEALSAAIRCGADAVYFGAENFNARRNAKNFSLSKLCDLVKQCHKSGVKCYLTLNTLVSDKELEAALSLAMSAAKSGVDAFIVQDLGLARLLLKALPSVPLHASTQMSVHSKEALPQLKSLGFKRVVVSREMSKENLVEFCEAARSLGIEVESFVHGALCMCLSGQCYLSSVLGQRSGNRGLCAQPCRLAFSADKTERYDLSLKDLSLIEYIKELEQIGITSFKIEGRMKRTEYVAVATACVRYAADGKKIPDELKEMLEKVFSRNGFTDGYYLNKLGKEMFGRRTENDVKLSAEIFNATHELYRRERQSVGLTASVKAFVGKPLEIVFDDGNTIVATSGSLLEAAENKAADKDFVFSKLSKLGGSQYFLSSLEFETDGLCAVSSGEIGELRRKLVEMLDQKRSEIAPIEAESFEIEKGQRFEHQKLTIARFFDIKQIPDDLSSIDILAVRLEDRFEEVASLSDKVSLCVDIPRGMLKFSEAYAKRLEKARTLGFRFALCGNLAAFSLAKAAGLEIIADFGMNAFNSMSVNTLKTLGASMVVLSFECNVKDATRMSNPIPTGIITYGRLPLMVFRNCPNKNVSDCNKCNGNAALTDRKGIVFPVSCRNEFSELYNSRPLCIFDRKREFSELDFSVLYFTTESKEECQRVLRQNDQQILIEGEYTRGLYYKEVQ